MQEQQQNQVQRPSKSKYTLCPLLFLTFPNSIYFIWKVKITFSIFDRIPFHFYFYFDRIPFSFELKLNRVVLEIY